MSSSPIATVNAVAKIDISPEGISISFEGLEGSLSDLLFAAKDFSVQELQIHSFDTKDVSLKSVKAISFIDPPLPPEEP